MNEIIKLSRSTVEKYLSCPRCCVLDKKYKIKPPSLPFTLNIAVDNLCKNEFDYYRKIQEPHPLFIEYGIDAVPFKHKDLERWRSNFQGIRYKSIEHNYDFGGAVDDIWQAFAVLLPVKTVGVMGDKRTYAWPIVLRCVSSEDGMTADWSKIPFQIMERIANRIVNEVISVNRVVYDITSKPPGTIEWE